MRKDTVAQKLERLEHEVLALKSEQRNGIDSLMTTLKQFQELMLEEKMASIMDRMSLEYRDMAMNNSLDGAYHTLEEKLSDPCPKGIRAKCLQVFLTRLEADAAGATCEAPDFNALRGTSCEKCVNVYEAEKDGISRIAERLRKSRQSARSGDMLISQLPDNIVISSLVEPLSHESRFLMLKSLSVKNLTYSELVGLSGLEGGHLLYHLNKLVSSGLVNKADGMYAISDRGMGIMELIKKLYSV
jgi:hypothetical protein